MKVILYLSNLLLVLVALCGRFEVVGAELQPGSDGDEEPIQISAKCAAVLVSAGTALGAGAAYALTPAAICSAGFCSLGVAGSSFASWWQSMMPLVRSGSVFAQLQSLAMAGTGLGTISVAGAAVGGAAGLAYVREICAFVDETDPDSDMGVVFSASLSALTTAVQVKESLESQCASSQTCSAAKEAGKDAAKTVSSKWNSFSNAIYEKAYRVKLRVQISLLEGDIDNHKRQFGVRAFELLRRSSLDRQNVGVGAYDYLKSFVMVTIPMLENIATTRYIDCVQKIQPIEAEIETKLEIEGAQPGDYSIRRLEKKIVREKGEFGIVLFESLRPYYQMELGDEAKDLVALFRLQEACMQMIYQINLQIGEKHTAIAASELLA